MKTTHLLSLTLVLVTVVINFIACSSSQKTEIQGQFSSEDQSADTEAVLVHTMKMCPQAVQSLELINFEELFLDDNVRDVVSQEAGDTIDQILGIALEQVQYTVDVVIEEYEERASLTVGYFQSESVVNTVSDTAFKTEEYGDFELWYIEGEMWSFEGEGFLPIEQDYGVVTVKDGLILAGAEQTVKEIIDTISGIKHSLYEVEDFRDISDRLPSGIWITIYTGFGIFISSYDDAIISGSSVQSLDDEENKTTVVIKFANTQIASENIEVIKRDMQNMLETMSQMAEEEGLEVNIPLLVTQDGNFIIIEYSVSSELSLFSMGS